jgi:hypothetical protein
MVTPADISSFTKELEYLLARTWEIRDNNLDTAYINKTREAVSQIREFYTFKKRMPSKINYRAMKYRAGYIASFGQRHAFLPYYQLKEIEQQSLGVIPKPINKEITVTLLGAGAALELFGILFYYNEQTSQIRKINLINIEKIKEWDEVRSIFIKGFLKNFFRKVTIEEIKINADLRNPCQKDFADLHEYITNTDILMSYNMLNENEVHDQYKIIENLRYIYFLNKKPLLTLLMEPSPNKSITRIRPFKKFLSLIGEVVYDDIKKYIFDWAPLIIKYEPEENGLNRQLFKYKRRAKYNPKFYNEIKRISFAAIKIPNQTLTEEFASKQLKDIRDTEHGYFTKIKAEKNQLYLDLGFQEVQKYKN